MSDRLRWSPTRGFKCCDLTKRTEIFGIMDIHARMMVAACRGGGGGCDCMGIMSLKSVKSKKSAAGS